MREREVEKREKEEGMDDEEREMEKGKKNNEVRKARET